MSCPATPSLPDPDAVYTDEWKRRLEEYFYSGEQFADSARQYWAFTFQRQWTKHQRGVRSELGLVRAISHWMPPAGKRALVMGSWLGQEAIAYALYGAQVVAIDLDEAALALSEELARRHGVGIETHVLDACQTPFPSESFDLVSCSQVLEHLPPQRQPRLLEEMWRLSRPGGLLWLDTPNQLCYKDKHDTGLPLVHWLPRPIKVKLAGRLGRAVATREPAFGFQKVDLHYYMSYFRVMRILRKLGPCEALSRYRGYADVDHYRQQRIWEGRASGLLFPLKLAALRLMMGFWNFNWLSNIRLVVRKLPLPP
jgi:SAM-dependent methyltransferase